jgi:cephalosporin-C deacetylase
MGSIDMPLEQLRQYKPSLYREADFDEYWTGTLREAMRQPLNAELIPYALPARGLECYAVRFDGFGGGRIAGWYVRPAATGKYPAVCVYHGYSGRAPRPLELIHLAHQGMCVLSMDCRGQNGQSQDTAVYPEGHFLGWMTRGIRDPQSYIFRYVFADAVRALEVLARRDEVDEERIAITGISQGGGITLAAAALSPRPALALADVPFLCDYRRAISIAPAGPYLEIPNFLKSFPLLQDQAIRTLSYCDCLNLAPRITCKTVILNCLWDDICPPSTIYAVYHHMTAPKEMEVYPFHKHEVPYEHTETKFRLIMEMAGGSGRPTAKGVD